MQAVGYLKPFKADYPLVSWADLIQMAGAVGIEHAGGPKVRSILETDYTDPILVYDLQFRTRLSAPLLIEQEPTLHFCRQPGKAFSLIQCDCRSSQSWMPPTHMSSKVAHILDCRAHVHIDLVA
eukprot:1726536-Amphidinium_carterae.1